MGVGVLLPSADGTMALLRRHRARLDARVRIALADEPSLAVVVNKERTLAMARHLGIGVPPSVVVGTASEVPAALNEIGLPAVVKPNESWAEGVGTRVVSQVVNTPGEAHRGGEALKLPGGVTLAEDLLSGRPEGG